MTAEIVTVDGEVVEHRAPLTLFGTDDPSAVVERATRVATVLADVIRQRHLAKRIGNRDHIQIEGWTLLGSMLGVFGEVEWTRPVDRGWEARAVARTMAGATVGAAEAMCTRTERTWSNRDEYAIRSMAQTRALSKALRLPLGFIVELAGFAATPAEEMDAIEQPQGGERAPAPGSARSEPATTRPAASNQYRRSELAALMKDHHLTLDAVEAIADRLGITERPMSDESMDRLIEAISEKAASAHAAAPSTPQTVGHTTAAATPAGSASEGDPPATDSESPAAPSEAEILAAAGPGAEIVLPKPGTPEYKALPSGAERAKARAYWDAQKTAEPQQESLVAALGGPEA